MSLSYICIHIYQRNNVSPGSYNSAQTCIPLGRVKISMRLWIKWAGWRASGVRGRPVTPTHHGRGVRGTGQKVRKMGERNVREDGGERIKTGAKRERHVWGNEWTDQSVCALVPTPPKVFGVPFKQKTLNPMESNQIRVRWQNLLDEDGRVK